VCGNVVRPDPGPSPVLGTPMSKATARTASRNDQQRNPAKGGVLFEPPRHQGRAVVGTLEAIVRGEVKVFIGLGGNYLAAVPDWRFATDAMRRLILQ
jgi:hypothetical protein